MWLQKRVVIFFFMLFFFSCCAYQNKKINITSPLVPLRELRNSQKSYNNCMAWEIKGSFYLFSKHQNYRANFSLKGNRETPWKMVVTWGMGSLIAIARITPDLTKVYSIKENTLYKISSPQKSLNFLGIKSNISYVFLLKVLTGEWKNFIPNPQKAILRNNWVRYFFKKGPYSELDISSNLEEINIILKTGEEINIHGDKKIVFVLNKTERLVFKIKYKKCLQTPYPLKGLQLIYPKGAKICILN